MTYQEKKAHGTAFDYLIIKCRLDTTEGRGWRRKPFGANSKYTQLNFAVLTTRELMLLTASCSITNVETSVSNVAPHPTLFALRTDCAAGGGAFAHGANNVGHKAGANIQLLAARLLPEAPAAPGWKQVEQDI